MSVHKVSTIQRERGGMVQADPFECRRHREAGRLPVFHGLRCVAYVDRPGDLPEATFMNRYGHLVGEVRKWPIST